MYKLFLFLIALCSSTGIYAQELNCEIIVDANKIIGGNLQVFKTLEVSIDEFINQTQWTDKIVKPQERIECSMVMTLDRQTGNSSYSGSIQVQSSRPVFNSIYTSPMFNYRDEDLNFSYTQFEPLRFDANTYESELISILTYYVYLILAIDADSFAMYGGTPYYETCQKITDQIENPNGKVGWQSNTSKLNRYHLLKNMTSANFKQYRMTSYNYHRKGLDRMVENEVEAKQTIADAILSLKILYNTTGSAYIFRIFMDAKSDEILGLFADGPKIDTPDLVEALNKMSPTNMQKWRKIK